MAQTVDLKFANGVIWLSICFIFIVQGSNQLDCDFEQDLCNWTQATDDDFDWKRISGATPTNNTGPDTDHTSGEGFYIYIHSKEAEHGNKARLISPLQDPGNYCLSFWYFMYGDQVGLLRVIKNKPKWTQLFNKKGSQGENWHLMRKNVYASTDFRIIIIGGVTKTSSHILGDIAVDDIVIFPGQCPRECDDPTPNFGDASSKQFDIRSIIHISCKTGYKLTGSTSIVCLVNGTWSERPDCNLIDCLEPYLENGRIIKIEATTYNSTAVMACNEGYSLEGDDIVTCQPEGNWSSLPTCRIINCLQPYIENGRITKIDATTYNSTAVMACNEGYSLEGDDIVTCQSDGNWSSLPTCRIINCSIPSIPHGRTSEIKDGTKFKQTLALSCLEGYMLSGNGLLTCTADGNWTSLPKCLAKDTRNKTFTILYILVPIVVVILLSCILFVMRKKSIVRYVAKRKLNRTQNADGKSCPKHQFQNKTYSDVSHEGHSNQRVSVTKSSDASVRSNEQNLRINAAYCDTGQASDCHTYDHLGIIYSNYVDMSYSHVRRNKGDSTFRIAKNTADDFCYANKAFQMDTPDESSMYYNSNVDEYDKTVTIKEKLNKQEDTDPYYDHAKAGGTNPEDLDNYSHLNSTARKPMEIDLNWKDDFEYANANEMSDKYAEDSNP